MRSRSTTTTCVNPSSAAFLRISLPKAPAPITSSRHFAIFSWSHQEISRSRLKRSSRTSPSNTFVMKGSRTGGDFWLQPQDVSIPHLRPREGLSILYLSTGIFMMKFVTQGRSIGTVRRQPQLLHQYGHDLVAGSVVRQFHRHPFILGRVVDSHVD